MGILELLGIQQLPKFGEGFTNGFWIDILAQVAQVDLLNAARQTILSRLAVWATRARPFLALHSRMPHGHARHSSSHGNPDSYLKYGILLPTAV